MMPDLKDQKIGSGEEALATALPPEITCAAGTSLRRRTWRASIWTLAGFGGAQVLRLGSSLVMTRLLFPEAFGLMALMTVFTHGLQMLSDLGIGPSIVQNKRGDDPSFLNTAWTLQILRGAALWVMIALVAIPAAGFYHQPQLAWLLPAVGLSVLISGFGSTALHTASRHLLLGRLTVLEMLSQCVSIGVMVTWALVYPSVWALVGGSLSSAVTRMVLSHRLIPQMRNRLQWDPQSVHSLLHFGKWIFASSALGFFGDQMDRILLPKLISFELMGVYAIAYTLSRLPDILVVTLSGGVAFPAIAQRTHLPREQLRSLMLRNRRPFLCLLAVAVALLAGFGDYLVRALYDSRYHDAAWMLPILAMGLWPRMLASTTSPVLLAIGQPRYFVLAGFCRMLMIGLGLPAAYTAFGVAGAVTVAAMGSLAEYVAEVYGLWRHRLLGLSQDLQMTGLWAGVIAMVLVLRLWLGIGLPFVRAQ
jgi:O-antigen/teichoic acid export membrane protein